MTSFIVEIIIVIIEFVHYAACQYLAMHILGVDVANLLSMFLGLTLYEAVMLIENKLFLDSL